jgi:hypothetical protein
VVEVNVLVDVGRALDRFLEAAQAAGRRRTLGAMERALEKRMARAFRAQGKVFLTQLAELKDHFSESGSGFEHGWSLAFSAAELETIAAFVGPLDDAARAALLAGANGLAAELKVPFRFDLENPQAAAYLEKYGARRVTKINAHTRDVLRRLLTQAIEERWTYNQTARAISARYKEFERGQPQAHIKSRAHLVAITEVGEAYEEGHLTAAREMTGAGIELEKSWLTAGDGRVSRGCKDNQAAGWIGLEDMFPSGHLRPLRFPGCRCASLYRRKRASD